MVRRIATGLLILAVVLTCTAQQGAKPAPATAEIGRYQIIESKIDNATFLLDTTNGHIWVLSRHPELFLDPTVWETMERLDTQEQVVNFLKVHPPKSTLGH